MTRAAQDPARALDWSRVQRVLLIRLRSIGDTVLMTACLDAIKREHPDIKVAVVSERLSAPILEDHLLVDQLFTLDRTMASRAMLIPRLRAERFDAAFNVHGGTTASILAALSGSRMTVGFADYKQSCLLKSRAPAPDVILGKRMIHSVEQQLALLSWSGLKMPERPSLVLEASKESIANVARKIPELTAGADRPAKPFALIAPGAALESKRWRTRGFAAIADHLLARWNLSSVIVAGPGQEGLAHSVCESARCRPPVVSGLSLKELIALISMSAMFVGNDSGPMHIAAALRRPLVAVFGSSNADVWHPWTDSRYCLVNVESAGRGGAVEIKNVADAEVIAAVDEAAAGLIEVSKVS